MGLGVFPLTFTGRILPVIEWRIRPFDENLKVMGSIKNRTKKLDAFITIITVSWADETEVVSRFNVNPTVRNRSGIPCRMDNSSPFSRLAQYSCM